jgi:broad specificity phosphatase PhoE
MHPTLPLIVLVRHGETAWTLSGQHTGLSDIALTDAGCDSARTLNATLKNFTFAAVFTSPLKRARQTAELAGYGAVAALEPDLSEWDYGDYEGITTAAIRAERPDWRLFEHGCPNGESPEAVGERANRVIVRIQQIHGASGNVLIFAHSDILRVLVARWLRLPALEGRRFLLATSSISVLGYDHDLEEPAIRRLNQAASDVLASP